MNLINHILLLGSLGSAEIILLGIIFLPFITIWKIFEKGGGPGWQAIIPIYNLAVIILWFIFLQILAFGDAKFTKNPNPS